MSNRNLRSPAWLLHGIIGSTEGVLMLRDERLSFTKDDGQLVFDAPLQEIRNLQFPWHMFGGGLSLQIGGDNYRVSLVRPGNTAGAEGNLGDVVTGREECKKWKAELA